MYILGCCVLPIVLQNSMFINIATENIIVQDNKSLCMIPFAGVEKELSRVVVSSYKTYLPDYIYVLNGP